LRPASVTVADGRVVAYEQVGDPAGVPVFVVHGTPNSRLSGLHPNRSRVADAGLRLIGYDRPGYGHSIRHPGRRIIDCVGDVAAIANELELERFAVAGRSGGGPHALAVGARLPERVTRVLCSVGWAPFDAPDFDWFEGMDAVNVREFRWALEGEETLARELHRRSHELLDRLADGPTALMSDHELTPADRAVLEDKVLSRVLSASFHEAFRQGTCGWVDDDLAFTRPWGFDVAELQVPVEIRYGAGDVLVPAAHGAWLAAHVPRAIVTVDHSAGHLATPDQHLDQLRALATA
jgi:pimeloyl-ACP methyl ester carboxylesterase